jgi:GNAT superfamily N-acetyltransferase
LILEHVPNPDPAAIERLRAALSGYNRSQIPDKGYFPLFFSLVDDRKDFAGGLYGYVGYGWLFIDTLWISECARLQGYGSKLMHAAEDIARKHGCRRAWLDTFSFQARRFYEKLGYTVFAELEEFPPGHQRYFLRKNL